VYQLGIVHNNCLPFDHQCTQHLSVARGPNVLLQYRAVDTNLSCAKQRLESIFVVIVARMCLYKRERERASERASQTEYSINRLRLAIRYRIGHTVGGRFNAQMTSFQESRMNSVLREAFLHNGEPIDARLVH
jgi:hypothetical protein